MTRRPAARLLIVDRTSRLLLFRFEHNKGPLNGESFWATPGGALEHGESFADAAKRELYEETGLKIADPGRCIANRRVSFALPSGEVVDADERYFLIRVDGLAVSSAHWTQDEREMMTEHRWWTETELAASHAKIWPETIVAMLRDAGVWPVAAAGRSESGTVLD
jgi:8-oxo-dGTP pyrophosphatase MutT (NUDIX family)